MKQAIGAGALIVGLLLGIAGAAAEANSPLGVDPALIDDLVAANHILYRQGVVDGFGHVSVRHPTRPDHFLMSTAKAPGRVTAADIMEFDADAKPVGGDARAVYSERFIHSEIYKARPDVKAIVHSHSPTVIPFSVTQVPLRPIHNTASFLSPEVPVFEMRKAAGMTNNLVTNPDRAKALVEVLGTRPVALLRGHGDVVLGPDIRRTVARAIYTEVNARMLLQAIALGGPITFIDPEEAKQSESSRDSGEAAHGVDRIWQMWVEEAAR